MTENAFHEKMMSPEELLTLKKEYIMPTVGHYYEKPMNLVRGRKQYLYDSEGKEYLDFFGGILTVMSGHCIPEITEKVVEQVKNLQHTSTAYLIQPMLLLAKKLSEITPGALKKTFFVNSGTEANEGAIMLAKAYTGLQSLIALQHSYHGQSYVARSVTGIFNWKSAEPQSMPGVHYTTNAYCYRCPFGKEYPGCNLECADFLETVIKTATPGRIAGLIAEPIQGVGGFVTPPKEYFPRLYEIVKKYGGLYISDEVQTAFGRTGGKMFGIEHWGVEPDIITVAKGLGNGAPIAAYIATEEVADSVQGSNICTFGGNHVSSVSGLANLDYLEKNNLVERTTVNGEYLKDRLLELQDKYRLIGEVRGKGLMIGIELVTDRKKKTPAVEEIKTVMEKAKDRGLLVGKGGLYANVIRLAPPLTVDTGDLDDAVNILDKVFADVEATLKL